MQQHDGADQEAPHEDLQPGDAGGRERAFQPSAQRNGPAGIEQGAAEVPPVQPAKLGKPDEVLDLFPARVVAVVGEQPADVRPPESALER